MHTELFMAPIVEDHVPNGHDFPSTAMLPTGQNVPLRQGKGSAVPEGQ